jgi:RNA polymerase sigma-70 factor (ECF subfamily)
VLAIEKQELLPVSPPIPQQQQEFAMLYDTYHPMVYRTAFRVTGNASDAEDVMQTVFVRLMKRDTSEMQQPESYLRRAAVNASIDLIRERQKAAAVPIDEAAPPACTELRELRDSLRKAIAKLDDRQALLFSLRYFEGHTNQEIAKMMGMSQIHVAVVLHRIKAKLQKELK